MKDKQAAIRRARQWLARVLAPDDEGDRMPSGGAQASDRAPSAPSPGARTSPQFAELEKRLVRFLATVDRGGKSVTAGAVQLIGLATIRERLGDKWQRFSERVHGTARNVIEQHLTDADVYSLYKDESYIILFSRASEEQARLKAKVIGDEIARRLFGGADSAGAITVKTLVYRLDGTLGLEDADDGTLLDRLFIQAQDGLDERGTGSPPPRPGKDVRASRVASFRLIYRPMWNVRKNVVSGFVATLWQGSASFTGGVPTAARDVDLFILKDVIEGAREIAEGAAKKVLIAPVHLSTLWAPDSRREYFELCRTVEEKARRYITFELILPDDRIVLSRLDDLSLQLRSFGRSLMCRLNLDFNVNALGFFRSNQFTAIGMALPSSRHKESDIMARLETFAAMAERHRVGSCYLHDVPSLSLMSFAIASGFGYLSGEPIGSMLRGQIGAYRFNIDDLYSTAV